MATLLPIVVESKSGNAYAVKATGSGMWSIDGAKLDASTDASSMYWGRDGQINLSEIMGLEEGNATVFYPTSTSAGTLVSAKWPTASAVAADEDSTGVALSGCITLSATAEN